ncbi:Chromosome segregation protein Spo0J, contains ParB-like nuclease domain [Amycolatopsis xylanica]|uniref:Chromosome segregation protein Spo0J, contains ParB-like nuclease domain n=2 Tax=Amycolatopsis xylanica TaxID=589385 RepID=A0A1H3SDP5_9PSEU|nr:Chromosome segregation protein Spo0J, contains ParB-like nuclease domain [Amycolatopsis xylanica]
MLKLTDSPRIDGEDPAHTKLLAEIAAPLPPIVVHRQTMRVIDGEHRVRAALLRGEDELDARFFDGDEDSAFIMAVEANLAHGLPLSLADRRAAAQRIVERHADWSDRSIAAAVGLSAEAVARVRRNSGLGGGQSPIARIGRDGRVRPVDSTQGRIRASQVLEEKPDASLRQIAKEAGISVGTARDVRDRVKRGLDPAPGGRDKKGPTPVKTPSPNSDPATPFGRTTADDTASTLQSLRKDPSLRFTEAGRRLLRWLDGHALRPDDDAWVVPSVPPHCAVLIAEIARQYAEMWHGFAEVLEQRGHEAT